MKTEHHNFIDNSGRVYCYKQNKIIIYSSKYFNDVCKKCDYFTDNIFNEGVTCTFDDKSNESDVYFSESSESELFSQMQYVRLGLKTKNEVINQLKSMDDFSDRMDKEDDMEEPENEKDQEVK